MNQNETTKKLSDLQVGDTAVIRYCGNYGRTIILTPVTVTKLLKSGKIKTRTESATADRTWYPDGSEYGRKYGSESLRPLNDGETAETIKADKAKAALEARAEAEAKDRQFKAEVAEWWNETGKAMWDARVTIPGGFLGKEVNLIRFERHGEQRMPFVIIEKETEMWGGNKTVLRANTGGLCGQVREADSGCNTSVSTYSTSSITGDTLEDVLYSVVH